MVLGFVLGFIAAYVSSAAIVLSWSIGRATSSLAGSLEAPLYKNSEAEMDRICSDELRCI